jgi:hypothetical protein
VAILAAVILSAVMLLSDGGEEDGELSAAATPESTEVPQLAATSTHSATPVLPTATSVPATPTPVPQPTEVEPSPLPDRTDCEEIRGTAYRSEQERQFFLANCTATPTPTVSTPQPTASAPAAPPELASVTNTIGGRWLLYDGVGVNAVEFDAGGNMVSFTPPVAGLEGSGSIVGDEMTFTATGFRNPAGQSYSVSYAGTRLTESEVSRMDLPFEEPSEAIAFFGELSRSDLQGIPVAVLAIKLTD